MANVITKLPDESLISKSVLFLVCCHDIIWGDNFNMVFGEPPLMLRKYINTLLRGSTIIRMMGIELMEE